MFVITRMKVSLLTVSVGEEEKVEAQLVKGVSGQQPGDRHLVEAVCHGLGQTTLTLTVANVPSASLPHPKKVRILLFS